MELLIKADMLEFVEFTENVSDVRFNRELKLITDNKVAPFISYELVVAMKALTRGDNEQTEIYQFWLNFVRPYCVFAVYERFVVTHGINFAPNGILGVQQGGMQASNPIAYQERATLKKATDEYYQIYLNKMVREFERVQGTFDSVTYVLGDSTSSQKDSVSGINAIGISQREMNENKFRL